MQISPNKFSLIKPEKSPVFYGYFIALVGTLGVIASIPGQTIGISTFTDPVKDALGLNRDQISNAYLIGTLISSLLLGQAGKWFDKIGARWLSFFAALGLAFSLFLCASSEVISSNIQHLLGTDHWVVPFIIMTISFFTIRFTGQGILTMSSRNMIMKWFDHYRGRVNAIRTILVSLSFSASPLWISMLIDNTGWQKAWLYMAVIILLFAVVILLFYRDNPENHGLLPDGKVLKENPSNSKTESLTKYKQFTLKAALKTRAFWSYALAITFNSFFITGFTFHVVSIFETAGFSKDQAISIFIPVSVISVVFSLVGNIMADFFKLNYFLFIMLAGSMLASFGLVSLQQPYGIYLIIAGNGIMGGIFSILNSITWPRFFGRTNLGAISGRVMSLMVFGSALAPALFSFSKTYFGNYILIGYLSLAFLAFVIIGAIKARNPQET